MTISKISLMAARALIGFSVLGIIAVANSANANQSVTTTQGVSISNTTDFTNNFQESPANSGVWSVKANSEIKSKGVTFQSKTNPINTPQAIEIRSVLDGLDKPLKSLNIETDKKVTIHGLVGTYEDNKSVTEAYGVRINAKEGVDNHRVIELYRDSKIMGDLNLKEFSNLDVAVSKVDVTGNVSVENNAQINLFGLNEEEVEFFKFFGKLSEHNKKEYVKHVIEGDKGDDKEVTRTLDWLKITAPDILGNNINNVVGATLNIKGNLTTSPTGNIMINTMVMPDTRGTFWVDELSSIKVTGKATIDSQSSFELDLLNPLGFEGKALLNAKEGVDIVDINSKSILVKQNNGTWKPSSGAEVKVDYYRPVSSYLSNPSLLKGLQMDYIEADNNYTYELFVDENKKNIFVKALVDNSKINTANLKDSKSLNDFLKEQVSKLSENEEKELKSVKKELEKTKKFYEATKDIPNKAQILANLDAALKDIENQITAATDATKTATDTTKETQTNEILAKLVGNANAFVAENVLIVFIDKKDNQLLASALNKTTLENMTSSLTQSGNTQEALGVLESLVTSSLVGSDILDVITNQNFFKEIRTDGQEATQASNTSSQLGAINIANDMAIGDRVARFNNPYMETKRFAALGSDVAYSYYEDYVSSVWANTFGGLNSIGGNNGGLYGITAGIDRNINDNLLLGGYFTYANSTIKTEANKQKSDNYQLGLYTLIKLPKDWEIGGKIYGQVSPTNQYNTNILGTDSADFTRKLFGVNGSLGKVFQTSNALFIKPFGGVNYYYSYTPNYAQSGTALAKRVRSLTNNALSLEAGLEARRYFGANSYVYITPKLEQYVMNNGDDYVARFAGSTSVFKIANNEKKKTYGQLTLGGNVAIKENLSLNIGGGLKQILAGKTNSTNETYLSGNIGLKYKF